MLLEFTGQVLKVLPLRSGVGKNGPWSRATVVFEVRNGRYLDKISCENSNEAEKFAKLQVGQTVHIKADVSSREYQDKWYTSIVAYNFEVEGQQPAPAQPSGDEPL